MSEEGQEHGNLVEEEAVIEIHTEEAVGVITDNTNMCVKCILSPTS